MFLRTDICDTDKSIESLRLEVLLQSAKVRMRPAAAYPSAEAKLLVAMRQNLQIMKTNRSIDPAPGPSQ